MSAESLAQDADAVRGDAVEAWKEQVLPEPPSKKKRPTSIIDGVARIAVPIAVIIFNVVYWTAATTHGGIVL